MIHFLVLVICFVVPIISWKEIKKRRKTYSDSGKEHTYFKVQLWYLCMVTGIVLLVPIDELYYPKYTINLSWPMHAAAWLLIFYELLTSVLPIFMIKHNATLREKVLEDYHGE